MQMLAGRPNDRESPPPPDSLVSRDMIVAVLEENDMQDPALLRMLDYTIALFEDAGLGKDYYGYHNIDHELAVTYVALLSACSANNKMEFTRSDVRHMYAAALFHDFDPVKSVDKPHEKRVLEFISGDQNLIKMMGEAGLHLDIVKALILRTTYPWSGRMRHDAQSQIDRCLAACELTCNDQSSRERVMNLGWYLSVVDRIGGYALGDFNDAMDMAKMNAHALGWRPSYIVQRSVAYFEGLLNNESRMCQSVLGALPPKMRKNFFDTVLSFMHLRTKEITIQAKHTYDSLRLVPTIETMDTRADDSFIDTLLDIFAELPKPLQFGRDNFAESVRDPAVILNTLRLNDHNGEIVGFAKGSPLENYHLDRGIRDANYGMLNTIFLEPLALRMGYWGLRGGNQMRNMFAMQSHSKQFKYLTSFALREVIESRMDKEQIEFVAKIDPERWDYYRMRL